MYQTPATWPADKKSFYKLLNIRLQGLIDGVPHRTANLANASALLYDALTDVNWAGFYFLESTAKSVTMPAETTDTQGFHTTQKDQLVLGPFQGKPACVEIEIGKGVCGTAVAENSVMLVKNVHEFPGHIACDGASNSEIVIPIHGSVSESASENGAKTVSTTENAPSPEASSRPVIGVLDIDSPILARFDEEDQAGLTRFVEILETIF